MSRQIRNRTRQKQINILHTTTRKRHSRQQMAQTGIWCGIVLAMIVAVGVGLHFSLAVILNYALYENPHYVLKKITVDPPDHISKYIIRQAAGLELGENLWTLNLGQIKHDLEQLPYVSSAIVKRQFPDKVAIHIVERVPVVKIVGLNVDLGTRETFYLDRDCIVLKPRDNENVKTLPEVIGLSNAELSPGDRLNEPTLMHALEILDSINHTPLYTSIDIRSIDLSQPLWITMETTRDLKITFRSDFIDQQLIRLQMIMERYDNEQRTLRSIDLTPEQNVPITFYQ